jgi:hypothetical protein
MLLWRQLIAVDIPEGDSEAIGSFEERMLYVLAWSSWNCPTFPRLTGEFADISEIDRRVAQRNAATSTP